MSDDTATRLSRRGFLGGAGVSAAATVLLDSAKAHAGAEPSAVSGPTPLTLSVNGA